MKSSARILFTIAGVAAVGLSLGSSAPARADGATPPAAPVAAPLPAANNTGPIQPTALPPPAAAYPPGAYPPGAYPPGAYPPGAYPPGAYPPPGYYPPNYFPRPDSEGAQRIPIRYELKPRYGLIIAGASIFGGAYVTTVLITAGFDSCGKSSSSSCNNNWPMYIPVLGPFLDIPSMMNQGAQSVVALAVFDGLVQLTGTALMIAGAATKHRVPIFAETAMLMPYANRGSAGLAAIGRF